MQKNKKIVTIILVWLVLTPLLAALPTTFAATIFSDGFESGDTTQWTGTTTSGSGTVAVSTEYAKQGTYSLKSTSSANADVGRAYKDFTDATTVYARGYFKFNATPDSASENFGLMVLQTASGASSRAILNVYNDGGTVRWWLQWRDGTDTWHYDYIDSPTPSANTEYCVEVKMVISATVGEARLYIDGTEIYTQTGLNTGTTALGRLTVGNHYLVGAQASPIAIYSDSIVIADDYIGPVSSLFFPYIQQVSDVDSAADVGTHGNFTAQQYAPASNYDLLTEATTLYNSTLITEGFEDAWIPSGWTETASSAWNRDNSQKHAGTYSAGYEYAVGMTVGDLFTPTLNLTGAIALYVSFYYFDDDCDANELTYDYYDNTGNWDNIGDLGSSTEDTFNNRINVKITDSQYLHSAFQLRIDGAATALSSGENFYVDDFSIIAEYNNYTLALEEQFTTVPTSYNTNYLCVNTGGLSAEGLNLQIYNGSWQTLGALSASQWNNYTVNSYVTNTSVYIRFAAAVETADWTQSTWNISSVYLWCYNSSSTAHTALVTGSISSAWSLTQAKADYHINPSKTLSSTWGTINRFEGRIQASQALTATFSDLAKFAGVIQLTKTLASAFSISTSAGLHAAPTVSLTSTWSDLSKYAGSLLVSNALTFAYSDLTRASYGVFISQNIASVWDVLAIFNHPSTAFTAQISQSLSSSWNAFGSVVYSIIPTASFTSTWNDLSRFAGSIQLSNSLTSSWGSLARGSYSVQLTKTISSVWDVLAVFSHDSVAFAANCVQGVSSVWGDLARFAGTIQLSQTVSDNFSTFTTAIYNIFNTQGITIAFNGYTKASYHIIGSLSSTFNFSNDASIFNGTRFYVDLSQSFSTSLGVITRWAGSIDLQQAIVSVWQMATVWTLATDRILFTSNDVAAGIAVAAVLVGAVVGCTLFVFSRRRQQTEE